MGALLPQKLEEVERDISFLSCHGWVSPKNILLWSHFELARDSSKTDLVFFKLVNLYGNVMIKLYIQAELKPKNSFIQPKLILCLGVVFQYSSDS